MPLELLPEEPPAGVLVVELGEAGAAEGDAGAVAGLSAAVVLADLDESELEESPESGFFAAALV